MINGKQRKLTNQAMMTAKMEKVLQELLEAQQEDSPFIFLPHVHKRTLRSLTVRDWILPSAGTDGTRYKITGRGIKALKAYAQPPRRYDGICPVCGVHPKKVTSNGKKYGYCDKCERDHQRRQWQMKGRQIDRNAPCSDCGIRPRHVYPSGAIIIYCYECRTKRRVEERRRKHARLLERIHNGEVLLCPKCKAAPLYHTHKHVYDLCLGCWNAYQVEYNNRRRLERGKTSAQANKKGT